MDFMNLRYWMFFDYECGRYADSEIRIRIDFDRFTSAWKRLACLIWV
jgi:hypothetical protein